MFPAAVPAVVIPAGDPIIKVGEVPVVKVVLPPLRTKVWKSMVVPVLTVNVCSELLSARFDNNRRVLLVPETFQLIAPAPKVAPTVNV